MNTMTQDSEQTPTGEGEDPRRKKLQRIIELGYDPYGQRFDDRQWINDIRNRTSEIAFLKAGNSSVPLPDESEVPADKFKEWLAEQGEGQLQGPTVRAAGRIMLHRDKGKLVFIDIQDWTGTVQLFIGKNQVGEENWELIKCLDLGDLIGVDGKLRKTKTGELSIFADQIHVCLLYTSPSPRDQRGSRMPSSA